MFVVKFSDGSIVIESQIGKWDNVPRDRKIDFVGVVVPLVGEQTLLLAPLPKGCERYCCTKLGRAIVGERNGHHVGYVLYGLKQEMVYRIELTDKGLGPMQIVPYHEKMLAKGAWRDGC